MSEDRKQAWEEYLNPDHEGYYNITLITIVKNNISINYQSLPKDIIFMQDFYIIFESDFEKNKQSSNLYLTTKISRSSNNSLLYIRKT
jgi:hypothetical protein